MSVEDVAGLEKACEGFLHGGLNDTESVRHVGAARVEAQPLAGSVPDALVGIAEAQLHEANCPRRDASPPPPLQRSFEQRPRNKAHETANTQSHAWCVARGGTAPIMSQVGPGGFEPPTNGL